MTVLRFTWPGSRSRETLLNGGWKLYRGSAGPVMSCRPVVASIARRHVVEYLRRQHVVGPDEPRRHLDVIQMR